jgi:hypothetical protein
MPRCTGRTDHALASVALLYAASLVLAACGQEPARPVPAASGAQKPVSAVPTAEAPAPSPTPKGPPVRLFASQFVVNIREQPSKEAFRTGYVRGGAVLQATTAEPVGFDKCRKGWYPLEGGGFVCSTVDAIAFSGKRLPERQSLQADLAALLPYPYGYSRRRDTPMYRRIPTPEEAALHEGLPMPASSTATLQPPTTEGAALAAPQPTQPAASAPTLPSPPPPMPDPLVTANGGQSAVDAGVPTLASLQGEQGGVLLRRMERGFYVSLDRELKRGGRGYYRTQSNGFIPSAGLAPVKPGEFQGVDLIARAVQLPIAFVMSSKFGAYQLDSKGRIRGAGKPGYHHLFRVVSEAEIRGKRYLVGEDGRHYRASEVARVDRRDKPAEVGPEEKWIDIDLTTQSLVAYVGDRPVYATLVSTGRIKDELDPQKNFATPTGAFRVTSKHVTATMDGDHAIDGPYSIEDVPYVMYFELAYALHGAFWHNGFGRPRSHGCVNLAPFDARWVFTFADPKLPVPWHGVYPTTATPGTRLYIRGQTPEG